MPPNPPILGGYFGGEAFGVYPRPATGWNPVATAIRTPLWGWPAMDYEAFVFGAGPRMLRDSGNPARPM